MLCHSDTLDKTKVTGISQVDNLQDGVNSLASGQLGKDGLLAPVGNLASKEGVNRMERGGKDDSGTYGGRKSSPYAFCLSRASFLYSNMPHEPHVGMLPQTGMIFASLHSKPSDVYPNFWKIAAASVTDPVANKAKGAGEGLVGGAQSAGSAVTDGAKSAGGYLGGMFGGGKSTE